MSSLSARVSPSRIPSPLTPGPQQSSPYPDLPTPTDSIRQYQFSIKAMLQPLLDSAKKDLLVDKFPVKHKKRGEMQKWEAEVRYYETDPFERHMLGFDTPLSKQHPATSRKSAALQVQVDPVEESMDVDVVMDGVEAMLVDGPETPVELASTPQLTTYDGLPQVRRGLIDFSRPSAGSTPSFQFSRSNSGRSSDLNGMDVETPGSEKSEASFEAVSTQDYVSMYGQKSRSSGSSTSSKATYCEQPHRPSPLGRTSVDRNRCSLTSSSTGATSQRTSINSFETTDSLSTITCSPDQPPRPSLSRRRPKASPHPVEQRRSRELSGGTMSGEMAGLAGPSAWNAPQSANDWLKGRTVSEQMVAMAGVNCQRGREGRGR